MNSGDQNAGDRTGVVDVVNPWEERKDRGRVSALVASLFLLATSPRRFFESVRAETGIWGPLLFVGLVTVISILLNGVILTIMTLTLPEPALELLYLSEVSVDPSPISGQQELPFGPVLNALIILQALMFLLPVFFALTLFFMLLFGALVHLLLVVTRTPRPHGFRGTWAALCYANGAGLLAIIPFVGDIASVVCAAILFGIGLRFVQGVGVVRATVLASILPLFALLGLLARMEAAAS